MSYAQERIHVAFHNLRKRGYYTEACSCCDACTFSKIPLQFQEQFVYYQTVDDLDLTCFGACFLSWKGNPKLICKEMKRAGLAVEWGGTPEDRIFVAVKN